MSGGSWTRTVDDDPVTRTRTIMHYDAETDMVTVADQQNVTDAAELAKAIRNEEPSWRKWQGDSHLVGIIPDVVYWQLWKEGRLPSQDQAAFRRWWNEHQGTWNTKTGRL